MKQAIAHSNGDWNDGRSDRNSSEPQNDEGQGGAGGPASSRGDAADERRSPFFWWLKVLMLAAAAVALFPLVFALLVSIGAWVAPNR
jgi:hypothetical protein